MTQLPLRLGLGPLAALSLLSSSASARVISGSVSDPNGLPLSGATVQVVETEESTISDARGLFSFAEAPDGNFTVRVISEDFEPVETTASAQTTSVEIEVTQVKRNRASLEVVSSQEDLQTMIPGSLHLISKEELIASKPIDSNEVLRRVPGVNLREDSGPAAMRLNIGIRGLNPNRSRKVLMLEDGIPIALAPYGEPDMYYSPPIERMSRVEILKGSGQIAHGPQTVGGLVNFVTPEPPSKFHSELDLEGGQRGLFVGQASMGGSNRDQSFGWITSYLHKQGDGWRQFFYDIEDVQTKFSIRPNDRHAIALKAGLYDEVSNSTYLGLTAPMYEANPNQNPVPSDTLDVERLSGALSHSYTISPRAVLSSTAFMYTTKRFWGRQDFDRSDRGRDYFGIAGDPSIQGGAIYLRKSAGNRNRLFNVFGAQSNFGLKHANGYLNMGVRYIYEKARDQRVNGDGFTARTGNVRDDEFRYGKALAGYIQNRFAIGSRVTVTPGIRFVHYNQERHITRKRVARIPTNVDIRKDNGIITAIPGLGFSVRVQDDVTFFTGVHRDSRPQGPRLRSQAMERTWTSMRNCRGTTRLAFGWPDSGRFPANSRSSEWISQTRSSLRLSRAVPPPR